MCIVMEPQAAEKAEGKARGGAVKQAVNEAIVEGVLDNLKDFVEQAENHRLEMQASSVFGVIWLLLVTLLRVVLSQCIC